MARMFALAAAMVVVVAMLAPQYAPALLAGLLHTKVEPLPAERPPSAAEARAETGEAARTASPGHVVLKADRRGHFMVDGYVGVRGVVMMVDTGATTVALTRETARKSGVNPPSSAYRYPVSTANGVVHAARITLPSLTIEGIRLSRVEAMVLPDTALDVNLLGMSYLSRLSAFEVQGDRLILTR